MLIIIILECNVIDEAIMIRDRIMSSPTTPINDCMYISPIIMMITINKVGGIKMVMIELLQIKKRDFLHLAEPLVFSV